MWSAVTCHRFENGDASPSFGIRSAISGHLRTKTGDDQSKVIFTVSRLLLSGTISG